MKKITSFLVLLCLSGSTLLAQKIHWRSFDEALELQKKDPKKILIDSYTSWCGYCKLLDKNTFQNTDVAAYINKNYYAVKFNAEGNTVIHYKGKVFGNPHYNPALANRRNSQHEMSRYFRIDAFPTIVFLDEQGALIFLLKGYKTTQDLELYLKMFKTDAYKTMDTREKFEAYRKAFKHTFKGK